MIIRQCIFLCLAVVLSQTSMFAQQFFLPDAQLFQKATITNNPGGGVGKCIISTDPHACSAYASALTSDGVTYAGLPNLYGSGCLNGCWGPPNFYYDYSATVLPICTGDVVKNGANMIRIGIVKGYCELNSNSSTIVPSNSS